MRLDKYLVEEGYFESRNRALEAVKVGQVKIDGKVAKASAKVDPSCHVEVEDSKFYVSRAARKLESLLAGYPMALREKKVLDIGSSTGGFAQILLENEVGSLVCVDVGRDQLHISLRDHPKISLFEEMDIRNFHSDIAFEVITCDVSFISVLQIVDSIDRLSSKGTDIVILYKPQFEVGREVKRDSRGVVQDLDAIRKQKEHFEAATVKLGWEEKYQTLSKIQGKEGNQEYLYHFVKVGN
jgi:23S rRNA (cytidine1920-2'-O)/16S rRNA (cytidine1409-2'-O)-methyltransferase